MQTNNPWKLLFMLHFNSVYVVEGLRYIHSTVILSSVPSFFHCLSRTKHFHHKLLCFKIWSSRCIRSCWNEITACQGVLSSSPKSSSTNRSIILSWACCCVAHSPTLWQVCIDSYTVDICCIVNVLLWKKKKKSVSAKLRVLCRIVFLLIITKNHFFCHPLTNM